MSLIAIISDSTPLIATISPGATVESTLTLETIIADIEPDIDIFCEDYRTIYDYFTIHPSLTRFSPVLLPLELL